MNNQRHYYLYQAIVKYNNEPHYMEAEFSANDKDKIIGIINQDIEKTLNTAHTFEDVHISERKNASYTCNKQYDWYKWEILQDEIPFGVAVLKSNSGNCPLQIIEDKTEEYIKRANEEYDRQCCENGDI